MKWVTGLVVIALLAAGIWALQQRSHRPLRVIAAAAQQHLYLGNGTEVETLDPHLATGHPEHMILTSIMEGLVAPGEENPDANAPGVAARWETEDYIHWTFHLRPEAKWSDGTPLTAQDFLFSYQRILSPALAADYSSMLYLLENAEAFNQGEITDFSQVGVSAPDAHTLKLKLNGPAPYLLGMLKHYAWFPVPAHIVLKHGKMTDRETGWTRVGNHVGNGPFQLEEWRISHYLKVGRNPHYWDRDKVRLRHITFLPISNGFAEERLFKDGQLHATSTLPLPMIPVYRAQYPEFYREEPLLAVYFYRVNVTKPAFKDKRVRQALSLAIDAQSLVDKVLRSGQKPATGITPYGDTLGYEAPKLVSYNLEKARQLLAEAGYPDGKGFPQFELLINTSESHRVIAETIQQMWIKGLNLPVKILNQDWGTYLDSQRKLNYEVCRAGWVGDYPDPYTFLSMWRTGDGNNNTGWGNPKYDELLRAATLEGDTAKRMGILKEAETILLEEMPALPIYWYTRATLQRPEVKGMKASVQEHRSYKSIWIDAATVTAPGSPSH